MNEYQRHQDAAEGLLKRLWIFQSDRFPLLKTSLLLAIFTSASISVSAQLAGRELPHFSIFLSIWFVTLIIFFQMRVCDEWKDLEDDRKYRPERPVPSGLISLQNLFSIAFAGVVIALGLTMNLNQWLVIPLVIVWLWLGFMTFEFFAPDWLKKHQLIYLISHMMIMPLIDLFITASEWLTYGVEPPAYLWLFLILSFVNGCVLEIGRKIWAPESEKIGVDSYSALWGFRKAIVIWVGCCFVSWVFLLLVGFSTNHPVATTLPGLIIFFFVVFSAYKFTQTPNKKNEKLIENVAGMWVFACYCLAGFSPLLSGVLL
ncbi:MAG: UbiA family prenyltransferase [Hyphomicrobiales bacterium]